ncbi:phage tail tape measure protein [Gaoshiqia sp. Z1-71]|uniref:phage tail tape measure protein n=1 Tax=Gaoshiqia hydrogeniformans TaxID=3290090 RepID=UPI003BF777D3
MANSYNRRINLYINGKEVKNDIGSIQAEMRKLIYEQRRMTIGSQEYEDQFKKIGRLKSIADKHKADIQNMGKSWSTIAAEKINKYFGLVSSGIASIAGLAIAYRRAADAADKFEERVDNLSALTGLNGIELEKLGKTAQETSVKITDGGVRIKQSADDIVDAYTKVGSQRPELLKDAEALAAVTEDAIILSEAAKSDLEPAVKGLTTTMNQFNLPASESRRIINAMAAGSKEGAADIPYLTQAIEKSGTTMNLMNVSLEENIGLIEAMAPFYAKAEMAGNSLDKVFLKLKEKQIGYVNGTFSVNAALEELERRYKNGESAASIFGVEHAKMGELLVQNRAEFNRYTNAVTGTNMAIEQAAKNTDNAKAIQAQANNAFHNAAIEIGKNLSPAMTALYQVAGSVATAFTRMIAASPAASLREEQTELNLLVTSIMNANNSQATRNKFIQALQEKYPDFLQNINTEKLTNEELRDRLKEVNKEYESKILLAIKEDALKTNYRQRIDLTLQELDTIKQLAKYEELANQARTKAATEKDPLKLRTLLSDEEITALNAMDLLPRKLDKIRDQFQGLLDEEAALNDAITELRGKLNIQDAYPDPDPGTNQGATPVADGTQPKMDMLSEVSVEINQRAREIETLETMEADWLAYQQQMADAGQKISEEKIEQWNKEIEARRAVKDAIWSLSGQAMDALIQVAGMESNIGKALFLLNQARAVGEVIFHTGIANAKAVAASPLTFGQPWVGINTASAGVSIASILAQTVSQAAKFATGGFTGGESLYVAGESGEEWIAPHKMINNPITGPVINWLEDFRKGRYTINPGIMEAVSNQSSAYRSDGPSLSQINGPQVIVQSDPRLISLLEKLEKKLNDGIEAKAIISKYGKGGLDEALEEMENFKNKVKTQ